MHQPARDFWETDPRHFWLLLEPQTEAAGKLSESDKNELLQMIYEARANG